VRHLKNGSYRYYDYKEVKVNREILFNKLIRNHIHRFIVWYLVRCGGAFHHGKYGSYGKYVALMSDDKYGEYKKL
jgi:hypothetical protein